MNAIRFVVLAFLTSALAACGGRSAFTPPNQSAPVKSLSELLKPYEISARNVSAAAPPVVGQTFDVTHSVEVPVDLGREAFGSFGASSRGESDVVTQLYAMVAVTTARTTTSSRRAVKDYGQTCYYLVTYLYNVRTGKVVAILGVQFEGCDGGGVGDGGGGGGGTASPPTTPPNTGCASQDQTAGKAYADIGPGNAVFNSPNPNSIAPNGQELYGYVYSNGTTNRYDPPTVVNLTGREAGIAPPNDYPGWHAVGLYHTHPRDPNGETSQVDQDTNNHFSPTDIATATSNGYPMYVAVLDTLSRNDPQENPATRWYKYDPATNTETLMSTVGSGGC